jgi:uncharacterized phiE125 gp8 family phage protein
MKIVERLTQPTADAWALPELREHARVDYTDADVELSALAKAAVVEVQNHGQLALLHQTVRLILIDEPQDAGAIVRLPIAPAFTSEGLSVTADGVTVADVVLFTGLRPALRFNDAAAAKAERIEVSYQAGWSDLQGVPADLRHAVTDHAVLMFDSRGASDNRIKTLSPHLARIVAQYRGVSL